MYGWRVQDYSWDNAVQHETSHNWGCSDNSEFWFGDVMSTPWVLIRDWDHWRNGDEDIIRGNKAVFTNYPP